ncbi:oxalate:formate antiporter-like isoform X1 [Haliotis rufescens]|uniref:oxalate:formate antiporter-like isoform X1 n=1 Tax=Haliotis rufescens TaxID=6454 RepID=UPI00201F9B83|nr:oxalate:formate antiporter-like isoform X1 [Haliotis rufescens]
MACWIGWPATRVIIGGVLIHLTLGTLYTFGNMNPYITSYLRYKLPASDTDYSDTAWVNSASFIGIGLPIVLAGEIYDRFGPRKTVSFGCLLMSGGIALTYVTIKHSVALVVLTYGLMFGLGVGMSYVVPMSCAMKWIPDRKGLACGLTMAGFGGGAFTFDYVQTWYINPDNDPPLHHVDDKYYFHEEKILSRVPPVFCVLAGCYAALQVIGILLLRDPPEMRLVDEEDEEEESSLTDGGQLTSITSQGRDEQEQYVSWKQSWKTKDFWLLWFSLFFNSQGLLFFSTFWKAYGQTFINDDQFLTVVGSIASLFNAGGRLFWGYLGDKFSFKVAMMALCAVCTVLMATYKLTELAGKSLFFIYVCLTFGTFGGNYSLFPLATAQTFGQRYFIQNYGLLFTSQVLMSVITAFTAPYIQNVIVWYGFFLLSTGSSFLSFILVFVLKQERPFI